MTSPAEMRQALAEIDTALAKAVTGSHASEQPHATLVASIDQIRGFVGAMATSVTDEPPVMVGEMVQSASLGLDCAACIQEARNREAVGEIALPVLRARTVINGLAFCDDRHKIVTPTQLAAQQVSSLLLPHQMPPGGLGAFDGRG